MVDLRWLRRPKTSQNRIVRTSPGPPRQSLSPIAVQGNIIDSYFVPPEPPEEARAQVFIAEKDNFGNYLVKYPELAPEQAEALRVLKENLEYYFPSVETFTSTEQMITQYLWKTAEQAGILGIVQSASEKLRYYLLRDAIGFGELDSLFNDDDLEEISCTDWSKPVRVYHRKYTQHRLMETNLSFPSEDALQRFVRRMAQLAGKSVSRAQPYVEGMLTHGAVEKRITATLANEVSRPGSTFVVRKQKENPLTVTQLAMTEDTKYYPKVRSVVATGPPYAEEHCHKTATALMFAYFWSLLEYKSNILICGEPTSGKTTFLNSILALTNPNAKVVTCEDSVTRDTDVLIKRDGNVCRVKIGDFIDAELPRGEMVGGCPTSREVANPNNTFVLTLDNKLRVSWAKCNALIRHNVNKELVKVITATGREIEVTVDHSLFSLDQEGNIVPITCGDLKRDDIILTPAVLNIGPRSPQTFDLSKSAALTDVLRFEGGRGQSTVLLATGKPRGCMKSRYIPSIIQIDDGLATLVGLWLGDGFYDKGAVGFSVGAKGRISSFVAEQIRLYGLGVRMHSDGVSLVVHSKSFKTFLESEIGLGGDDYTRRVPEVFFNTDDSIAASLLRGYFSADGSVAKYEVSIVSASPNLLRDVQSLLLRLGIVMRIDLHYRRKSALGGIGTYRGRICGRKNLRIFSEKVGFLQEDKNEKQKLAITKTTQLRSDAIPVRGKLAEELRTVIPYLYKIKQTRLAQHLKRALQGCKAFRDDIIAAGNAAPLFSRSDLFGLAASDIYFDHITKVERRFATEYVYDISVPETAKFVANNIICHNTAEVLLPEGLHWERLVTRHAQAGLSPAAQRYEVDLAALLKLSLRFSPTILSLGEMRGEESESVANAMTIGYSTICTVHAASARDCITRITSPPMRFTMGHVRDISAIVTMRRIKLPDGREVRRVASVDEVAPNELDHSAYEVRNVFAYHPDGDSFTPTTPEEVLERSYRLRKAGEYFGWSSEHMLTSLTGRAGYLTNAIREGVFTIGELSEKVRTYYAREFLKELRKEAR